MNNIQFKRLPAKLSARTRMLGILAFCLFVAVYFSSTYVSSQKKTLKTQEAGISNYTGLVAQEAQLRSEFELKRLELEENEESSKVLITKESFIKYVGKSCKEARTDLVSLTGGVKTDINESLSQISFQLEVVGALGDVHWFVGKLEALKSVYVINSMSLRKTDEFAWLDRKLTEMTGGSWFDLGDAGKPTPETVESLGVKDIYGTDEMRLFLDISFITVNE